MSTCYIDAAMVGGKDIARKVGRSKETVSAVLSGRWRQRRIAIRTRDEILATAQQMGYVPQQAGRRLVRTRANCKRAASLDQVGVILHTRAEHDLDPTFLAMLRGAEHEIARGHASLNMVRVNEGGHDGDGWEKIDRLSRSGSVDGWLLYGPATDDVVARVTAGGPPCVIIGDHRCTRPVHSVNVDNVAVGRMAVEHLASLGHRRIGYLGFTTAFAYQRDTLTGFRAAVKDLGLDGDDRLIADRSMWKEKAATTDAMSNVESMTQWLAGLGTMPTALVAPEAGWGTQMRRVIELCQIIRAAPVRMPQQMSLVACEPVSEVAASENLTRVELPLRDVGTRAAELLRRIVTEPDANADAGTVMVAPRLAKGWSTGPPPH